MLGYPNDSLSRLTAAGVRIARNTIRVIHGLLGICGG